MQVIIFFGVIFLALAILRLIADAKQRRDMERIKAEEKRRAYEAALLCERMRKQEADAKAMKREQERLAKEQEKERREREAADAKLAKEQARQAKELERIRKTTAKLEKAIRDIEYLNDYCNNLYQLLDIVKLEQAGAVPGSKTDVKCQKKILTYTNQIHSTEERLIKAREAKTEAEIALGKSA